MAVRAFLQEKVDVAIIEVGIGGEYDPTNVVTNVPVAGITSLGFDHTSVLGNTIESISWNKAGIMKKGSQVFTVCQPESAYNVLYERSIERQCTLTVVEDGCHIPIIQKYPSALQININLAIKMAEAWMSSSTKHHNNNCRMDLDILKFSIENCVWPGRYDIRQEKNIRYYIDGAHTLESIDLCLKWYLNDVKNEKIGKALLFNLTGGRSCDEFFKILSKGKFETVIFVPNVAKSSQDQAGAQLVNCYKYKEKWMSMNCATENLEIFSCVQDAVDYLNRSGRHNLLITGSLYLVGAVISILDSR
ncbi:hypothetical protein HHI36_013186 [Cryptolaemus montrouzieri]|uniref:tetrahydrofolate synthase n=1 Tax=Cryptolaemus montrouzieri TaxID=559131 RepID=A0ABD2NGL4_9CUCU